MSTVHERRVTILQTPAPVGEPGVATAVIDQDNRFDRGALERCACVPLEKKDADLLTVLAAVAFADRRLRRRRGTRWARSIRVQVPVHLLPVWMEASTELAALLGHLTGDVWTFDFVQRRNVNEFVQLFLPRLKPEVMSGAVVVPYSGGLDSFAAMRRLSADEGRPPCLIVHALHAGRSLHEVLPSEYLPAALAIPFTIGAGEHAEPSYRSRTFIFFTLAALACRLVRGRSVVFPEGGVGSFGPAIVPFGIETPARGCHPSFTERLRRLLGHFWGTAPTFEYPHLWLTKGEVLSDLRAKGLLHGWQSTQSCSRQIPRQKGMTGRSTPRHCGVCAGCLFRRQSLLAAGLGRDEDAATYWHDVLRQIRLPENTTKADREVGTYAVLSASALAEVSREPSNLKVASIEVADALGLSSTEVEQRLGRLLSRHALEWQSLVNEVPAESWLRALTTPEQGDNT